jgi:drug/metabolite transporter (DMT)-like permease
VYLERLGAIEGRRRASAYPANGNAALARPLPASRFRRHGSAVSASQLLLLAMLVGVGALVLAALLWSLGSVYSRDAEMPKSSLMGTGIEMLAGAAGLFIAGTLSGEWQAVDLAAIRPTSLVGLAYLVTFGSLIGFVAYAWLLRNAPLSLVSTYAYVNPVIAIFLGAWLGSELINAQIIVAALVIIGSVVMINLSKQSRIQPDEEGALNAAD